jgi:4-hydroxybutyrate dehydrogenase
VTPFVQLPKLIFDFGAIQALPSQLRALGSERPLLITDAGLVACGTFDRVLRVLPEQDFVFDSTPENPTSEGVDQAFAACPASRCDAVVAVGGGSVIDTAKMVAVLAGQGGSLSDFLGRPEKVSAKVAPLIAIPTTASSGSEVIARVRYPSHRSTRDWNEKRQPGAARRNLRSGNDDLASAAAHRRDWS